MTTTDYDRYKRDKQLYLSLKKQKQTQKQQKGGHCGTCGKRSGPEVLTRTGQTGGNCSCAGLKFQSLKSCACQSGGCPCQNGGKRSGPERQVAGSCPCQTGGCNCQNGGTCPCAGITSTRSLQSCACQSGGSCNCQNGGKRSGPERQVAGSCPCQNGGSCSMGTRSVNQSKPSYTLKDQYELPVGSRSWDYCVPGTNC